MKITPTEIDGAYFLEIEPREDERGFFARGWCVTEFEEKTGIRPPQWVQSNISRNRFKGTLRGMHFQRVPHGEVKLLRCLQGAVYDVALDVREGSRSFGKWAGVELTADNYRAFYIPEGVAHGYLTLTEDAVVFYEVSGFYHPESEGGVRWDDPAFAIRWPEPVVCMSDKDHAWPLY